MQSPFNGPSPSGWQDSFLQHKIHPTPTRVDKLHYHFTGNSELDHSPHLLKDVIVDGQKIELPKSKRISLRDIIGHWLIRQGERMITQNGLG